MSSLNQEDEIVRVQAVSFILGTAHMNPDQLTRPEEIVEMLRHILGLIEPQLTYLSGLYTLDDVVTGSMPRGYQEVPALSSNGFLPALPGRISTRTKLVEIYRDTTARYFLSTHGDLLELVTKLDPQRNEYLWEVTLIDAMGMLALIGKGVELNKLHGALLQVLEEVGDEFRRTIQWREQRLESMRILAQSIKDIGERLKASSPASP